MNRQHDYVQQREKAKTRLSHNLRLFVFRNLTRKVTSFALRKIYNQWKRLTTQSIVIEQCTNNFITIMRLSCAHRIQHRIYNLTSEKILLLKDINFHWRFTKSDRAITSIAVSTIATTTKISSNNENIDIKRADDEVVFLSSNNNDNLQISNTSSFSFFISMSLFIFSFNERSESKSEYVTYNESVIVKLKDRSSKLLNKNLFESQRRQQIFEIFTRRKLSEFERIESLSSLQTMLNSQLTSSTSTKSTRRARASSTRSNRLLVKSSRRRRVSRSMIIFDVSKSMLMKFSM